MLARLAALLAKTWALMLEANLYGKQSSAFLSKYFVDTKAGSAKSFTAPSGVVAVKVHLTGGGGGGGSHNNDDAQGGGGSGGTAVKLFSVSAGEKFTYDLGAGGRGAYKEGYGARSGALNGGHSHLKGKNVELRAQGGDQVPTWGLGGKGGDAVGGDLNLMSMEGYGTDAFLHLCRLGNKDEPLP